MWVEPAVEEKPDVGVAGVDRVEVAPRGDAAVGEAGGAVVDVVAGLHQERVAQRLSTGNVYVNRNIIGAVVGVQPFGGHGLSGTGPKAGGPHYLMRFATEQTVTINTAAAGGNASLIAMGE